MFVILWAVGFFVATLIVGTICLEVIGRFEGWDSLLPLRVAGIWAVILFGSPLVGLSLGSRGMLPGTKKNKKY
jgi:hypothetical protein